MLVWVAKVFFRSARGRTDFVLALIDFVLGCIDCFGVCIDVFGPLTIFGWALNDFVWDRIEVCSVRMDYHR